MSDQDSIDTARMSFGDHLEELRRRLIHAIIGVVVASVVMLIYGRHLVTLLRMPLVQVQREFGLPEHVFAFSPFAPFGVYMKISLIAGLIIASPWVLYQLWKFVSSGLYRHERRVVYILAPFSTLMTALGVLFAYFVMLPICLLFLVGFAVHYPTPGEGFAFIDRITAVGDAGGAERIGRNAGGAGQSPPSDLAPPSVPSLRVDPEAPEEGQMWLKLPEHELRLYSTERIWSFRPSSSAGVMPYFGIGEYMNFALLMMLGIVIGFQLPVAMLILGWTGLVDPRWFRRYRKHALIACFVMGALLTPADPVSMFILAVPLYLLFELGLLCMRAAYRRTMESEPE